jgi:hypothetical protein
MLHILLQAWHLKEQTLRQGSLSLALREVFSLGPDTSTLTQLQVLGSPPRPGQEGSPPSPGSSGTKSTDELDVFVIKAPAESMYGPPAVVEIRL